MKTWKTVWLGYLSLVQGVMWALKLRSWSSQMPKYFTNFFQTIGLSSKERVWRQDMDL